MKEFFKTFNVEKKQQTFSKTTLSKKYINIPSMCKHLEFVRPYLGPNCLQRLSSDDKSCGAPLVYRAQNISEKSALRAHISHGGRSKAAACFARNTLYRDTRDSVLIL